MGGFGPARAGTAFAGPRPENGRCSHEKLDSLDRPRPRSRRLQRDHRARTAGGAIPGPVLLDRTGRFSEEGAYIRGGGPVPIDDSTRAEPARYAGQVRGSTMELTVTLLDGGTAIGPYPLTRGGNPQVFKCL